MSREIINLTLLLGLVSGHGYLWSPPGRGTARHRGYTAFPINYNHMANFCGGFQVQWEVNGGRCGVCGDRYDQSPPRSHEVGGPYGPVNRPVTGTYQSGSVINVGLYVTAYHRGFFSFRLCVKNNFSVEVTQDCLNRNLIIVNGTDSPFYSIKNHHKFGAGYYTIPLQLPTGVVATQAALQWNYTTGNSWNGWPGGPRCTGCGPQETFINCADIAIVASVSTEATSSANQSTPTSVITGSTSSYTASQATPITSTTYPTPGTSLTTSQSTAYQTKSTLIKVQTADSTSDLSPKITSTPKEIVSTPTIPTTQYTTIYPTTTTTTTTTSTSTTTTSPNKYVSLYTFLTTFDSKTTAASTTENSLISTLSSATTSTKIATSSSTLTSTISVTSATATQSCTYTCSDSRDACRCSASGAFAYYFGMSYWCWLNCKGGYCPPSHCQCFCYS